MINKQLLKDKNHPDYKQGIRAYTAKVFNCPVYGCNRLTNLFYQHAHNPNKLVLACSRACAKIRS